MPPPVAQLSQEAAAPLPRNRTVCYRHCRATWQVAAHDSAAEAGSVAANDAVRHRQSSATSVEDAAAGAVALEEAVGAVTADSAVYHRELPIAGVDAASLAASIVTGDRAAGYCQCRSGIVKDAAALLVAPKGRGRVADAAVG